MERFCLLKYLLYVFVTLSSLSTSDVFAVPQIQFRHATVVGERISSGTSLTFNKPRYIGRRDQD